MPNTVKSFEEWLKDQGVVLKRENTSRFGDIRHDPNVNYIFDDPIKARLFAIKHNIVVAHPSRGKFLDGDQIVFNDRFTGKKAIMIDKTKHEVLQEKYSDYVKQAIGERPVEEMEEQLSNIQKRIKYMKADGMARKFTRNQKRLNRLHGLARNMVEGWHSHPATSDVQISLENYIAMNREFMSREEIDKLKKVSTLLMGTDDSSESHHDLSVGIKQFEMGKFRSYSGEKKLGFSHYI